MKALPDERTDLTRRVAEELGYLAAAYERWCEQCAQQDELSYARFRLLGTLWMEGPMKMGELARALGVTGRTITALVDGLEKDDLVERRPVAGDRRAKLIVLAPATIESTGARLTEQVAQMASAFADLSEGELEGALKLISRLRVKVDQARAKGSRTRPG